MAVVNNAKPVAVIRDVGGTTINWVQMALDGDDDEDDDDGHMFCIPATLSNKGI